MCSLTEGLSGESEGKGLGRPTSLRAVNWIRMKSLQTFQDRLGCVQTLPVPPWFRLHEDIEPPFAERTFPWLQHRTHGMKPWKKKWQPCISTLDYYFPIKQMPHNCWKGFGVNTALEPRGKSCVNMRRLSGVVARTCNCCTREAEVGGSQVHCHPRLYGEFWANLRHGKTFS